MSQPAARLSMASSDNGRTVTFDLMVDGVGYDLTGTTVECHMQNIDTGATTTVTGVVAEADQTAYPGRCVTTFAAAQLVAGVYTLEWEITDGTTIITCPGEASARPRLTVRSEAA